MVLTVKNGMNEKETEAAFIEKMIDARVRINARMYHKEKYIDIIDGVVDFAIVSQDSLTPELMEELGVFLLKYGTYTNLKKALIKLEFSEDHKALLGNKLEYLQDKRANTRRNSGQQVVEQGNTYTSSMDRTSAKGKLSNASKTGALYRSSRTDNDLRNDFDFSTATIENVVDFFATTDTKDYYKYYSFLENKAHNSKVLIERKRALQAMHMLDQIVKKYKNGEKIDVEAIKEPYWGKKSSAQNEICSVKYSDEQKYEYTNSILLPHKKAFLRGIIERNALNATTVQNVLEKCAENKDMVDTKLLGEFVLRYGDLQWNNLLYCIEFGEICSLDMLRSQQESINPIFEQAEDAKIFYTRFAQLECSDTIEMQKKFLDLQLTPTDVLNFYKKVKDANISLLSDYAKQKIASARDEQSKIVWDTTMRQLGGEIKKRNYWVERREQEEDARRREEIKQAIMQEYSVAVQAPQSLTNN